MKLQLQEIKRKKYIYFFTLRLKWVYIKCIKKKHIKCYAWGLSLLSHTLKHVCCITGHKPFSRLLCDLQFRLICCEASAIQQYTVRACLPATVRSTWAEKI